MTATIYGPQTEQIKALIVRVRTITSDETARLTTAWLAVDVDDRDDAWHAGRVTALDAGRETMLDAADFDAVYTPYAIWDAALALLVRDLIGPHGFTQEHYNTLVAPWAEVVGKAHPDDEDVTTADVEAAMERCRDAEAAVSDVGAAQDAAARAWSDASRAYDVVMDDVAAATVRLRRAEQAHTEAGQAYVAAGKALTLAVDVAARDKAARAAAVRAVDEAARRCSPVGAADEADLQSLRAAEQGVRRAAADAEWSRVAQAAADRSVADANRQLLAAGRELVTARTGLSVTEAERARRDATLADAGRRLGLARSAFIAALHTRGQRLAELNRIQSMLTLTS